MKLKLLVCLCTMLLLSGCFGKNSPKETIEKEPSIRVCLTQAINKESSIESTEDYKILNEKGTVLLEGKKLEPVKIAGKDGQILLNGKKYPTEKIEIKTQQDALVHVNSIPYRGNLFCVMDNGRFLMVNIVPIENYVSSVIGSEMNLSWPESTLEAQAIIARTYAYHEKAMQKKPYFDVYDSTASQVYKGAAKENEKSQAIAQRTRGMLLLYQNRLFKTFFHSTCGGHTSNAKQIFDYHDISPLAGVECPYCKSSPYFSWSFTIQTTELEDFFNTLKLPLPFRGLSIEKMDKGKRVMSLLVFYGKDQNRSIKASELRNHFGANKLRSTSFTMESAPQGVLFQGHGWGHGVGLCQFGAKTMGDQGHSSPQILQFYYPCAQIYRLWK